ncbi:1-phosphatidylinositol 4,5-bisphosphate phosphodiesterase eta-2-like isoform X2 [Mizuhopecten yessoensis]|uniref:1-phosphatidylinositol 4,5-bisphosphate phosphodiesterase eta-2-like isoform X2 n=1 Tax=Mizuhopecten yessoensis TaxID=6573 RepID=UPI000B45D8CC|nr:1-phosphatidylinositol 4,5-bisphosphate phosphodiesterase eta-2-like isoform X2 [Mizuhopecten yessoensis]
MSDKGLEMSAQDHPVYESHRQQVDRVLSDLSRGTLLHKVKSGGMLYPRTFFLDTKDMVLRYTGSEKRFRKKKLSWQISKIREVRDGEKDYSKRLDPFDRGRCFAVIFGANHEVLYLYSNSIYERDMWVKGIQFAIHMEQYMDQKQQADRWIKDAFNMADKNNDGSLDFEEVMKLLKQLNADMDKKYVKALFDKADTEKSGKGRSRLDNAEFVQFYHLLTERAEVEEIFLRYDGGKGYMDCLDLQRFLKNDQKVTMQEDDVNEVIAAYEPQKQLQLDDHMSLIGFRTFLTSRDQQMFNPACRRVYQDMTQPITNYYISSSHNTYLVEDQLKGPSRVEAYITALSRGCRCVELDCWDGPDDEPVIYHGYTLTSKILFRDVIGAIKDYAFHSSPRDQGDRSYPVILSIENHCSIKQQTVMGKHIRNILGDLVYAPTELPNKIPSPADLMGKIVLKGKKLPWSHSTEEAEVSDEEDEAAESQEESKSKDKSKHKLSRHFSDVVGMKAISFKSTDEAIASNGIFVSLGESKVLKMIGNDIKDVNRLSQQMLVRTYPSGSRTDSSNYNPVPMWAAGCQVVALNFQTTGAEPMQLLHGKFLDNGGSGYVLKPEFMLSAEKFSSQLEKPTKKKKLVMKMISGYQIPKPKDSKKGEVIDPFIKIEVHGSKADNQQVKTSVIQNNGFNPQWNETVSFNLNSPELVLLRFVVYDSDRYVDDFIGYYVMPLSCLQQGYRHFPLFNKTGDQLPQALIFVHTEIVDA